MLSNFFPKFVPFMR